MRCMDMSHISPPRGDMGEMGDESARIKMFAPSALRHADTQLFMATFTPIRTVLSA